MSDENTTDSPAATNVEALRRQIRDLTTERDSLRDELKETRHEARDRRHEAKSLTERLETLVRERDEFRLKAEVDPEGLRKQLQDAQNVVRGLKHDRAFVKVAQGLSVNDPSKLADLVVLADFRPESEEPDEAKIRASFQEALKGRSWLLDSVSTVSQTQAAAGAATIAPGGASGATTQTEVGKPGPGADRGQSLNSEGKGPPANWVPGRI